MRFRSLVWISLLSYLAQAQTGGPSPRFAHYAPDVEPEPVYLNPICDAGPIIIVTCTNHHLSVGLTALNSKHYDTVLWDVNKHGVTISNPTSVTPILTSELYCDDTVRVHLTVKSKRGEERCYVDVKIMDKVRPTFTYQVEDKEAECDDIPIPAYVAAKDDCDKHIEVHYTEVEQQASVHEIVYIRQWSIVDTCGNSNIMSQRITVVDTVKPTLVGVDEDITVDCDQIPKPCVVVSYDNCEYSDHEIDYIEVILAGKCYDSYRIVRTWTAEDGGYNVVQESQTIHVVDVEKPVFVGLPGPDPYNCDNVPDIEDIMVKAVDNCDEDVVVHYTSKKQKEVCDHEYEIAINWSAIDNCGNEATAFSIIPVNALHPGIVGIDITVQNIECDEDFPVCEPRYEDACDYDASVDHVEDTIDGTCPDEYTVVREWVVQNVCAYESSVTQTIHVADNEPPRFTSHPPINKVVNCNHIPVYDMVAVDDCDDIVQVIPVEEMSQVLYQSAGYNIFRSWTAIDNCGNTAVYNQTLSVVDNVPPTIFGVPPHTTVECDEVPSTSNDSVVMHDDCDCDHLEVSFKELRTNGSCPGEYKLIRVWQGEDCSGNKVVKRQSITVVDTTKPKIFGAPTGQIMISIEEKLGLDYFDISQATTYDNCDEVSIAITERKSEFGTCPHEYKIIKTMTAVDFCGNYVEAYFTIYVSDKTPPTLQPLPQVYETWPCDHPRLLSYGDDPLLNGSTVVARDNSDIVQDGLRVYDEIQVFFHKLRRDGTCEHTYEIVLEWFAIDACNNRVDAQGVISIIDDEAPTLTKPQRKIILDTCDVPEAVWQTTGTIAGATPAPDFAEWTVYAVDNCDVVTVVFDETSDYSAPCPNEKIVYRSWTAVDDCGNAAPPVYQTIYVVDKTPPTWYVPAPEDHTYECEYDPDYAIEPRARDEDCHDGYTHDLPIVYTEHTFLQVCEHEFTVARKWTVKDCVGNYAFQMQTVSVVDNGPPVFTYYPADETVDCIHAEKPEMTTMDNCGYFVKVDFREIRIGDCTHQYNLHRHWVATDVCGNKAEQFQTITVVDREIPTITGPGNCVVNCDVVLNPDDATCEDDCAYATMSLNTTIVSQACPHNYVSIREWRCEDDCGKVAWHKQTVEVTDFSAPHIIGAFPFDESVECDDVPEPSYTISGEDDCGYPVAGVIGRKIDPVYGSGKGRYDIIRLHVLMDTCGNSIMYERTIWVIDTTPPVITGIGADVTVPCQEYNQHLPYVYASDNCDPSPLLDYTKSILNIKCNQSYDVVYEWIAEDECGNVAIGRRVITVIDDEKPIFSTYKPAFHFVDPFWRFSLTHVVDEKPIVTVSEIIGNLHVYDNCDSQVVINCTLHYLENCSPDDYSVERVCVAFDACGNGGYATSQVIEVTDRTPCPFFTVPADTTIECDQDVDYTSPTHDCEYETLSESLIGLSCEDAGKVVKTWTITDECGNKNTATQTITVRDTTSPVVANLQPLEFQCEKNINTTVIDVTDNCDPLVDQTYNEVQNYYNCQHDYQIVQQWFVKDRCQNSHFFERTITVKDELHPSVAPIPMDETVDHTRVPLYPEYIGCSDNCNSEYTTATFEETKIPGTCPAEYTLRRKWCCTDCTSHTTCDTQEITVTDTHPPQFYNCPPDITIMSQSLGGLVFPTLTAGDDYGNQAVVTKNETGSYGSYLYSMVLTRTWLARDKCQNEQICIQMVYVTEPPPIFCVPENMTLDCTEVDQIPSTDDATAAIQECSGPDMMIEFLNEITLPGDCNHTFCLIRTWSAVDNLKGSIKHNAEYYTTQTICVHDLHGPVWNFEVYRTVDCSKERYLPQYLDIHPVVAEDDCDENITVTSYDWTPSGAYGYHYDYVATDSCGHEIRDRMQVVIVDMEDPQFTLRPKNMVVNCTDPPLDNVQCTDNCGVPVLNSWEVILEQPCAHVKKIVRGWRCVDEKGNEIVHQQTIQIRDDEPPQWVGAMPFHMTLQCDDALPAYPDVGADDNCLYDLDVIYLGETHFSPPEISYATPIVTVLRSWKVYDDCGRSLSHVQSIVIYDTEYPVLIGVPDSTKAECEKCLCASVTATDNCGDPQLQSWNVTTEGSCLTEKVVITWWEACDDVGHCVHDSQTLIIEDTEPPSWDSGAYDQNIFVDCHQVPGKPKSIHASDNCDPHVTVVYTEEKIIDAYSLQAQMFAEMEGRDIVDSDYTQYEIRRMWVATDSCGHRIVKVQTVFVNDETAPTWDHHPKSYTYKCDEVPDHEPYVMTATDNCDSLVRVEKNFTTVPGTCPNEYEIIREWRANDHKHNSIFWSQKITVTDDVGPVLGGLLYTKSYVPCEDWPSPVMDVTASDECGEAYLSFNESLIQQTCLHSGVYQHHWIAEDECGNTNEFKKTVFVTDTVSPVCTECPEVYGMYECDQIVPTPFISWMDNCDPDPKSWSDIVNITHSCGQSLRQTYTYHARDDCGNSAIYKITTYVQDTHGPMVVSYGEDLEVECDVVSLPDPAVFEDNCDLDLTVSSSTRIVPGTCKSDKIYVYTFTATDDCGNTNQHESSVQVYDHTPPVIFTNYTDATWECDNIPTTFSEWGYIEDNCDGLIPTPSPERVIIEGSCHDSYKIKYTWSATDECGNTAHHSLFWTVQDTTPPTLDSTGVFGGTVECDSIPEPPVLGATDNCGEYIPVKYEVIGEGSIYDGQDEYEIIHYWTAIDICGNIAQKNVTIFVQDTKEPVLVGLLINESYPCDAVPAPVVVECKDNCDQHTDLTFTQYTDHGTCEYDYDIIRTWVCVDNEGWTATGVHKIDISDSVKPMWEAHPPPDVTIECQDEVPVVKMLASDNCDYDVEIVPGEDVTETKCTNITVSTWVATDACGNMITEEWSLTVTDMTPPTLSDYPPDSKVGCNDVNLYDGTVDSYSAFWPGEITAFDNCEYVSTVKFELSRENLDCDDEYLMILQWTATDACANEVTHYMTVYVFDSIQPHWTFVQKDSVVGAYAPYETLTNAIINAKAEDDCDQTVTVTGTEVKSGRNYDRDCENEWVVVRHLIAHDNCGNSIQHVYTIEAIDTIAPTLPSIEDLTVECDEYDGYADCVVVPTSAGDEDLEVTMYAHTEQFSGYYVVSKSWSVTDCAYMTSTTEQKITVVDSTEPVFSRLPEDMTVSCDCEEFPEAAQLKAYDNCDQVTVVFVEDTQPGTCDEEYTITRYWYAEDSAGNRAEHFQTIEVFDIEPPTFCDTDSVYEPLHYSCDMIPEFVYPLVVDNCDPEPEIKEVPSEVVEPESECSYAIRYPFVAVDSCGYTLMKDFTVTVYDDVGPVLDSNDEFCLFPLYGREFGGWAVYEIDDFFQTYDNCDHGPSTFDSYSCNVTDSCNDFSTKGDSNEFLKSCYVRNVGGQQTLFVKIDKCSDPAANNLGRTYHVYATASDSCSNSNLVTRNIFVPRDGYIFQERSPCEPGTDDIRSTEPVYI